MGEHTAQPILTPLSSAAIILVLTVHRGGEPVVRDLLPDLSGLRRAVGFRDSDDSLSLVTGFGSAMWDRLFGGPRPAELHPFRELTGDRHRAPSTPGDLVLHLRAARLDLCFELASLILARLAGAVSVVDETHGFRYFDRRDLLGFVDGTENPEGPASVTAAIVGEEDPQFTGGSYVVVQKYLHDLAAWNRLSTEEQEGAVGRTKLSDVELADDVKPSDSHLALTVITGEDGEERQIMRFNMPFGTLGTGEFGTFFIGYAASPSVTEKMLENMFIGDPPGNTDRLLDFSTAVTGGLFYVPTADFLDDPPGPPMVLVADRGLGVGDLKANAA